MAKYAASSPLGRTRRPGGGQVKRQAGDTIHDGMSKAPDNGEDSQAAADQWDEVSSLLTDLYRVTDRLETLFAGRKFTPDDHLVGSIGEVIAAHMFSLELRPNSASMHDADSGDVEVQIKLTQGIRGVALRAEPKHLLVLRLAPDRSIETVYNGRGHVPWSQAGKMQKNGQRSISLSHLRSLDKKVSDRDRLRQERQAPIGRRDRVE